MKSILKKMLSAIILTSFVASSAMSASALAPMTAMDIEGSSRTAKTPHVDPLESLEMPKALMILEDSKGEKKPLTLKEEMAAAALAAIKAGGQEAVSQIKDDKDEDEDLTPKQKALKGAGAVAKAAGSAALQLITFDRVMDGIGIIGAAAFGPEVLVVTEGIKAANKVLNEIPFVKDVKARATQFILTTAEKGITIAAKKTYRFISNKIKGWFSKKKAPQAAPAA